MKAKVYAAVGVATVSACLLIASPLLVLLLLSCVGTSVYDTVVEKRREKKSWIQVVGEIYRERADNR